MPRTARTLARYAAGCCAAWLVATVSGWGCDAAPRTGPQTQPATNPSAVGPPSTAPATVPSALSSAPPTTQPTTPPVTQPAAPPAAAPGVAAAHDSRFGVNLERLVSWSRSKVYIDAARTAYGFDTIAHPRDGKAPLGPGGWPSGDFGLLLIEDAAPSAGGTYRIVFPGAVGDIRAGPGAKVTGLAYDADAGVTRADVSFDPGASNNFNLQFVGAALKGRLRVLRPGYTEAQESEKVFTDEFVSMLQSLSPGVIRGMDFLLTNDNAVVRWQDRPTRDTPLYSETYGDTIGRRLGAGPVEDLIDVCNLAGADLWLNVPVAADADYRGRLADLVAARLRRDLRVYVEYGNENWNRSFGQHELNVAAARAERAANGYDAQDEIAGWQRTASETARLGKVFRAAFGQLGPGQADRVRPVLCGQGVNLDTLKVGLQYLAARAGKPADLLYGIAIAPYSPLAPDLPLNDWRVRLLAGTHVTAFVQLADAYGLASCCYESGVDLTGTKLDPAAQRDPRMEAVMGAYWAAWKGTGPVLHYNLCNDTGAGKAWGLTDDAADLSQPKFRAAMKAAKAVRAATPGAR